MTYSATKFEVAMSNRLGGDTFTKKVRTYGGTDVWTDGQTLTTDRLWYAINIHFFSKEKSGYNNIVFFYLKILPLQTV